MLTGTANQLFGYFEAALAYAHLPHYVLEATVSVNSPSKRRRCRMTKWVLKDVIMVGIASLIFGVIYLGAVHFGLLLGTLLTLLVCLF